MGYRRGRQLGRIWMILAVLIFSACEAVQPQEESEVSYRAEYTAVQAEEAGAYSHCLTTDGLWYIIQEGDFTLCHSNAEGIQDREIQLASGEIPLSLVFAEEKQKLICLIRVEKDDAQAACMLRAYDTKGGQLWEQGLESFNNVLIQQMLITASGRIYAASDQELFAIEEDGSTCNSYPITGDRIAGIAMDEEENIYVVQSCNGGYEILQLNRQAKTLEDFCAVRTGYSPVLSHGEGLYFTNSNKLFQYVNGWQDILSFAEQAINGDNVREILCTAVNQYRILSYDVAGVGDWELTSLTRKERVTTAETETVEKVPLSIATVVKGRNAYTDAIVTFNRSYPEYYLYQKEYVDGEVDFEGRLQQIQASLLSSDAPDLLEVYSMKAYENYVDKGYLESLTPYLEGSDKVDLEDFLPEIVEAYTKDGQIYGLPTTFSVNTLACSERLLGEQTSWTIEEFLNFLEEHPNIYYSEFHSSIAHEELTPDTLLYIMLNRGLEGFVDWETGEAKLDSDRFRNMLERIKNFSGAEPDPEDEAEEVILWSVNIYQAGVLRDLECENHEEMVLIGYPTAEGDEKGRAVLSPSQPLAIPVSSEQKEGAWLFIERQLASEYRYRGIELPTRMSQLEKKLEFEWEKYKDIPDGCTMSEEAIANYLITERHMNMATEAIENAVVISDTWVQICWIIRDEAEYYFSGAKSLDEVIDIMQNRVQLYLNEQQ